jgi:hypothetical protein
MCQQGVGCHMDLFTVNIQGERVYGLHNYPFLKKELCQTFEPPQPFTEMFTFGAHGLQANILGGL